MKQWLKGRLRETAHFIILMVICVGAMLIGVRLSRHDVAQNVAPVRQYLETTHYYPTDTADTHYLVRYLEDGEIHEIYCTHEEDRDNVMAILGVE